MAEPVPVPHGTTRLDRYPGQRRRKKKRKRRGDQAIGVATGIGVARSYNAQLQRMLRVLNDLLQLHVLDQLPALQANANAELALDATSEDLDRAFAQVDEGFTQEFTEGAVKAETLQVGLDVSALNRRSLGGLGRNVAGMNIFADDPALARRIDEFARKNRRLIAKMKNEQLNRVRTILEEGLQAGRPLRDILPEVAKAKKSARNRAKLIARDQVATLNSQLTAARFTANGVDEFEWVTRRDGRVRASHRRLNGKVFPVKTGAPGIGRPGEPINCRCRMKPVFPEGP